MKIMAPGFVLLAILIATLPVLVSCRDDTGPAEQTLDRAAPAQVKKAEVPGITNFSRVGNTFGFGGATDPSAMAKLKNDGFALVINLRLTSEPGVALVASRAAAQAVGLKYIHLPFDVEKPEPELVNNFLAVIQDKTNQPTYVHCNSATRVAALWMIKRVLEDEWEIDSASEEAGLIAEKPDEAVAFATHYIMNRE
jgi:uncharacterized protein (TIGR01244 family)